jgi:hypothetical protein
MLGPASPNYTTGHPAIQLERLPIQPSVLQPRRFGWRRIVSRAPADRRRPRARPPAAPPIAGRSPDRGPVPRSRAAPDRGAATTEARQPPRSLALAPVPSQGTSTARFCGPFSVQLLSGSANYFPDPERAGEIGLRAEAASHEVAGRLCARRFGSASRSRLCVRRRALRPAAGSAYRSRLCVRRRALASLWALRQALGSAPRGELSPARRFPLAWAGGPGAQSSTTRSLVDRFRRSMPWSVTATMSSIRAPKRPGR